MDRSGHVSSSKTRLHAVVNNTLIADGLCPPFSPFFTTQPQLLVFQLVSSAGCGGTNQGTLLAMVFGGLGCKANVTAVEVFRLESSLVREGTASFCPILPCFHLLFLTPGCFHSQKGSHLLPITFILFGVLSPLFVFSRMSCLFVVLVLMLFFTM